MKRWLIHLAERAVPALREWTQQLMLYAENNIPGATGAEKKAYVVGKLDEMVMLPWYLEPFDGVIFGALVDFICARLNTLYGHGWGPILSELASASTESNEGEKEDKRPCPEENEGAPHELG